MLGFIGAGNMARAMISGLVSSKTFSGSKIAVFDPDLEKTQALTEDFGIVAMQSESEVASICEAVILAVKPNILANVLSKISNIIEEKNPLVLSIAAGKSLEFIAEPLFKKARIVRIMPNINAVVGEAVSAFCGNESTTEKDLLLAEKICKSFGKAIKLPEAQFPIFGVIGGCSPAFAYMFIDAMATAAVQNGMPKAQALEICAQAVLGSAKMVLDSGVHPMELTDRVCSPGGTTIEGVLKLKENRFDATVASAVNAAFEKDKRL